MVQETPRQGVDAFFNGNYDVISGYVIPDVKDLEFGKKGRELELANGASTTYL
jgi:hypothetical protein